MEQEDSFLSFKKILSIIVALIAVLFFLFLSQSNQIIQIDTTFLAEELKTFSEQIKLRKDSEIKIIIPQEKYFHERTFTIEAVSGENVILENTRFSLIKASHYINYFDWKEYLEIELIPKKIDNKWSKRIIPSNYISGVYVLSAIGNDNLGNEYVYQTLVVLVSRLNNIKIEMTYPLWGDTLNHLIIARGNYSSDLRAKNIIVGIRGGYFGRDPVSLCSAEIKQREWECLIDFSKASPAGEYNLWTVFSDVSGNTKIIERFIKIETGISLLPLNPNDAYIIQGQENIIGILANGVSSNLESIFFKINFDPKAIEIVNVKSGDLVQQEGVVTEFNYDIDQTEGIVIIGIERRTRVPLDQYGGILAEITVRSLPGESKITQIDFLETSLFDSQGEEIIHFSQGQTYSIKNYEKNY